MTIYRFKIYNSIGNVFNQGRMVGSREEIERFCRKQIIEAKKNSPCNWEFIVELISKGNERTRNSILKQKQ